jgi:hypothetical protein
MGRVPFEIALRCAVLRCEAARSGAMQGVVLRCNAGRRDAKRSGGTMNRGSKQLRPGNVVKEDH